MNISVKKTTTKKTMALDLDMQKNKLWPAVCFSRLNSAGTVSKTFLMLSILMSVFGLPVKKEEKKP